MVQRLNDKHISDRSTVVAQVDMRSKAYRKLSSRDVATLYWERPRDERVWHLSLYEVIADWEVKMLIYPQSLKMRIINDIMLNSQKLEENKEKRIKIES